ncbi:hypothetical protein [Virgibacillus indicus]|uniref:hypothetical protein n=1 Tax=Virgibacillus indicus TaxID=2024554 RepID=UPI001F0ABC1A|nr:hypothetical protein [Virgibacillus indicus]
MSEKKVYVLLTDTGTLFTKTIKLYTRKPYNHASIAFDENLTEVYSFGRKSPGNPFIGGFVKEDIKKGLFKNATCAVYSLTVSDDDLKRMQQFIRKLDAQKENYRYNLIGLFAVMFNKQLTRENAFFCSQFVATVLNHGESVHFEKPLSLITPQDLQTATNFKLEYKGKLRDYKRETAKVNNFAPSPIPMLSAEIQ